MFGFKLVHKRELALYAAQIDDFHSQVLVLRELVEHERRRAEGAINLLLMRTQKAALTPEPDKLTEDQQENLKAKMLNIFGDEYDENDLISRVQDDKQ
jgi:hypothetical protein